MIDNRKRKEEIQKILLEEIVPRLEELKNETMEILVNEMSDLMSKEKFSSDNYEEVIDKLCAKKREIGFLNEYGAMKFYKKKDWFE